MSEVDLNLSTERMTECMKNRLFNWMNGDFTHIDPKNFVVKADKTFHKPHHLDKLIKQNVRNIEMMRVLMELLVKKTTCYKRRCEVYNALPEKTE